MNEVTATQPDLQRGLVYTVHPRILAPLVTGDEYRILVSTKVLLPHNHLEEHIGLKRESTRAPLEVLVIESVERPTPD